MNIFKTSNTLIFAAIASLLLLGLSSCSGELGKKVDPTLNEVFTVLDGELVERTFPEAQGKEDNQPVVSAVRGNGSVIAGGANIVNVSFTDAQSDVAYLAVGMDDEDGHYKIPVTNTATDVKFVMALDQNGLEESHTVHICMVDEDNNVSERYDLLIKSIAVGTGNLQVSLAWDLENDVDLHVVQPDSQEIWYGETSSSNGGELDLDSNAGCSIDSVRHENITYDENAVVLAGEYIVRVDYYEECQADQEPTLYVVFAYLEGELIASTSGSNPFEGQFATGTSDGGAEGSGVEVMRFNVPEQIGKDRVFVIDYDYTARQRRALNPVSKK